MKTLLNSSMQWWRTDAYEDATPLPESLKETAPYGVALVNVNPDGSTQPGWGGDKFMDSFKQKLFAHRPKTYRFKKQQTPFAIVMRSVPLVCIDIDGKNGGLEGVNQLGLLPPTLAETSKSGDGYHLFYAVEDEWHEELGFAGVLDAIGIVPGVDIRGVGCVYHYAPQRWNTRQIADLPEHVYERLISRRQLKSATADRIEKVLQGGDDMETAMLHSELERELAKPIASGARNNTLFAIGSQMKAAGMKNWSTLVGARANAIGLAAGETAKLLGNIEKYA